MEKCTRPGCPGYIEDGFCNVDGLAPEPAPPPGAAPAPGQAPGHGRAPGTPGPASASGAGPASGQAQHAAPGFAHGQGPGMASGSAHGQGSGVSPGPGRGPGVASGSGQGASSGWASGGPQGAAPGSPSVPAQGGYPTGSPYVPPPAPPSGAGSSGVSGRTGGTAGTGSGRTASGRTASGRSARTGRTGSTGSSRRGMLGAGLVEVPPVPYRDPATAIMRNPEVPENRRFCSVDGEPVGRSRNGRPGRTEGYCPKCGHAFSFTPKLQPGELVGGQYEVLGALAHGGLGWVYLARDKNVSDSWRVLKGLLDSGDADAMQAAAAERAYLAQVDHPNIVKIYNFVQHPDPGTGELVGYIVMEYVGGESLKDILSQRRKEQGETATLPLTQVIAYGIEVLRAMGYLHSRGLLYCDFKPDNAIQSEEQLKLIDLGGVRRIDDDDSPIFGTVGYQAPEIGSEGTSVTSDLFTVARTLAVLSFPFRGYTGKYATTLPPRHEVPLLMRHESYYRFLLRATHPEPGDRFQDAAEMAEQLTGVLREVLAAEDGRPRPAPSTLFGPEQSTAGTEIATDAAAGDAVLPPLHVRAAAAALPAPQVSGSDPAAGFLAGLTARDPADLAAALAAAPVASPEVSMMLVRVRIELGALDEAGALIQELDATHPDDWRLDWYQGLQMLAGGDCAEAVAIFDDIYNLMPGEMPPKLALAFAHECGGNLPAAAFFYDMVARTDPTYVSAAFGAARVRLAMGDRAAALQVLDSVPRISTHHVAAQLAAVSAAVRGRRPAELSPHELAMAGRRLGVLRLDAERSGWFTAEVLEAALGWALEHRQPGPEVLGAPMAEDPLRRRLEETYRGLARLADDPEARLRLVDRANAVRPRTLW
ncbi:serine/threonine-protein kinase [Thermomonospora umbrina]|uniref:non-specific serine/threonine protein kinase n=1 Tax=Thermomonospora umbrina TaxID=111806 RepID=A0A3D9SY65_9ACTN|nr:serine/threonine-protein kinase [Thermomonospora umbrina]REE97504.1 serine/threonine-protein kinase PknG [Thermomonospora umbrina]